jgi:hypothetical protein
MVVLAVPRRLTSSLHVADETRGINEVMNRVRD